MKYCEKCQKSFPDDQAFCSECGQKLENSLNDTVVNVTFKWPKSPVWLFGKILIRIDRNEPPIELKNGKSETVSLPLGVHHFAFCAKGLKKGVDFEFELSNAPISFICNPSSEAVKWGIFTSKPSVTVTQEIPTC